MKEISAEIVAQNGFKGWRKEMIYVFTFLGGALLGTIITMLVAAADYDDEEEK